MHKKAIEIKERILGSEVCLTGSWCDRYVPFIIVQTNEGWAIQPKYFGEICHF